MKQVRQLLLSFDVCHYKGCTEPVVCSSIAKRDKHVCNHHNNLEWAKGLARGKSGYWSTFGKRWLSELQS